MVNYTLMDNALTIAVVGIRLLIGTTVVRIRIRIGTTVVQIAIDILRSVLITVIFNFVS